MKTVVFTFVESFVFLGEPFGVLLKRTKEGSLISWSDCQKSAGSIPIMFVWFTKYQNISWKRIIWVLGSFQLFWSFEFDDSCIKMTQTNDHKTFTMNFQFQNQQN